jgi:hypothetical protein
VEYKSKKKKKNDIFYKIIFLKIKMILQFFFFFFFINFENFDLFFFKKLKAKMIKILQNFRVFNLTIIIRKDLSLLRIIKVIRNRIIEISGFNRINNKVRKEERIKIKIRI